jgi:hypothetical protein
MYTEKLAFAQLIEWVPHYEFRRLVTRYNGDYKVSNFSCWDQFLCMAFAQLTYRESLRDIEACLRARPNLLYHLGIRGHVARSTLADANEQRDWRIYAGLAQKLIARARKLYAEAEFGVSLDETVYAFDSTTIELCLSLFPWARFRRQKAGIKLHTLLDLHGSIPSFIALTDAACHDVNALDALPLEPGAFYVMDRGYVDFARLFRFTQAGAFFVTCAKEGMRSWRHSSRPVEAGQGVRSDQLIRLSGQRTAQRYPALLRRVTYYDPESFRLFVYLTNHLELAAFVIALLYKSRWRIELFFKGVKGNLRIRNFYGTSENAVQTQIWIAVCVYVLVAIVSKELCLEHNLATTLQILSVSAFEKVPLHQLLAKTDLAESHGENPNQLVFNGL